MFDKLRQAHLHAHDWQQESLTFVPLRGTWFAQSEHSFDLEEETAKFLSSDKKVLLILGDSGSGKSLYTQGLASKLWSDHKDDSPIPVWISLPSLKNPVNRAIEETFEKFGFNSEEIKNLRLTKSFIFIFDAFDEIHQLKNLWVSNHLDQWKAKIIITCRREYLYHVDNYKLYFTPFKGERALHQDYEEMIIKPFSEEQIEQYIKQYIQHQKPEWSLEQYQKAIEEMPGLKNLIKTPFLLKLAMEALPKMPQSQEQKQMTQAKLYDVFIEQWFIRQEQKLKLAKKIKDDKDIKPEFWDYAKRLAQLMHQQKITQVTYDSSQSSDLFGEVEDNPWQKFFNAENPRIELVRTACLVRDVGQHQYAFIHNSLLEYFLTRNLYENLLSNQQEVKIISEVPKSPQLEDKKEKDYFNERLLVEEANTLQFLADRIDEDELFKKSLFDRVYASRKNPQTSIQASNALTILNHAHIAFSGMDLIDIQAPDADLSNAILSHSSLKGANLKEVILVGAYLGDADFTEANIEKAHLGEYPTLYFSDAANCICYSKDGHYMAVGSNNSIILYSKQLEEYEKLIDMRGHTKTIKSITFSLDGKMLASSDNDTVRLWDVINQKLLAEIKEFANSIAFSPDGKTLATVGGRKIRLWDVFNQKLVAEMEGQSNRTNCVAFSPDGKILASASGINDYTIVYLWDVRNQKSLAEMRGHTDEVYCVAFSPDGKTLASSGSDKTIRLWDVINHKPLAEMKGHIAHIHSLAFKQDGKIIASAGGDTSVRLWDAVNLKPVTEMRGHSAFICCIAFSPDGKTLASGSQDQTLRFWDIPNQQLMAEMKRNTRGITSESICSIAYSPDGKMIALGVENNTVHLWDAIHQTGISELKGHANAIKSVSFSSDGKRLASGSKEAVFIWDVINLKLLAKIKGNDEIQCVSFSPDRKVIAAGTWGGTIHLWDAITYKSLAELKRHTSAVKSISFTLDGKMLASGSWDKTVCLWDVSSQKLLGVMKGHTDYVDSVACSPDGKILASGSRDKSVRLWNIINQKLFAEMKGHLGDIYSLAFSPDGKILSSGGFSIICLWDVTNQKLLTQMRGHTSDVNCVTFSPDGKILASGSRDTSIVLWSKIPVTYLQREEWSMIYRFANSSVLFAERSNFKDAKISKQNFKLLKQLKAKDYTDPDYFYRQGNTKFSLENYAEAIKDYDEAIRLNSGNAIYFNKRGEARHELKYYLEAIGDYAIAIKLDPNNAAYYFNSGTAKVELNKMEESVQDFDEAIKLNPTDDNYFIWRANSKYQFGKKLEALKDYDAAIKLNAKNPSYFMYRGNLKFELNFFIEAMDDYLTTIDLKAKVKSDDQINSTEMHFCLATCLEKLGRFAESVKVYDKILNTDKAYAEDNAILRYKGCALFYLNDFDQALKTFDELLKDDKGTAKVSPCYKGFILLLKNEIDNANKLFTQVLSIKDNFYLALVGKALLAKIQNQAKLAVTLIDQAITETNKINEKIEIYHIQGNILSQLNFVVEAEVSYEKALDLQSDYEPVIIELKKLVTSSNSGTKSSFWSSSKEQVPAISVSQENIESKTLDI
jgi:WD40 repeat protein/tetratricopeptide (TPR) repeat protein